MALNDTDHLLVVVMVPMFILLAAVSCSQESRITGHHSSQPFTHIENTRVTNEIKAFLLLLLRCLFLFCFSSLFLRQRFFNTEKLATAVLGWVSSSKQISLKHLPLLAFWGRSAPQSSGPVWKSRWPSWAPRPNEPYVFCGRKTTLNHAHALVTVCP